MKIAEASSQIAAPIELVWSVMLDVARYGEWNPFLFRIDGAAPRVGGELLLHVKWARGGGAKSRERITKLEPPTGGKARFEYDFVGPLSTMGAIKATRAQTLETRDGKTHYHTVETFGGWLQLALPLTDVQAGFEIHAQALKTRSESLASGAPPRP